MWYSIYTVGDLDIDQEHANIDAMLSCLSPVDDQARKELSQLISALCQHFINEERIADEKGYAMADSHRAMHRELTIQLKDMKASLEYPETDSAFIAHSIQDILRAHIVEYDRFILPPPRS